MCKTFSVPNWLFLKVSGTYIQLSSPALLLNCCLALTPYLGHSANMKAHDQKNLLSVFFCSPAPWTLITFTREISSLSHSLPFPPFCLAKSSRALLHFLLVDLPSLLELHSSSALSGYGWYAVKWGRAKVARLFFSPLLNKCLLSTLCSLSTRGCLVYQCCHIRQ